ncbi:unnamed protein product [Protopolystoma xenopodis]|uniref:Uncharacterized protein n=1 Tax=Protopolystoma xenopodis TaxID=117903 RepID=A0A448XSF8_9PLAT|nr:unnamed protein product [Protopolystoma xenopodis]
MKKSVLKSVFGCPNRPLFKFGMAWLQQSAPGPAIQAGSFFIVVIVSSGCRRLKTPELLMALDEQVTRIRRSS